MLVAAGVSCRLRAGEGNTKQPQRAEQAQVLDSITDGWMTTQHLQADSVHYIRWDNATAAVSSGRWVLPGSRGRFPPACFVGATRFGSIALGAIRSRQRQHQRSYPALGRSSKSEQEGAMTTICKQFTAWAQVQDRDSPLTMAASAA